MIEPLQKFVVLKLIKETNDKDNKIASIETSNKNDAFIGKVTAVGPDVLEGKEAPKYPKIRKNAEVIYKTNTGTRVKIQEKEEKEEFLILSADDIIGLLHKDAK